MCVRVCVSLFFAPLHFDRETTRRNKNCAGFGQSLSLLELLLVGFSFCLLIYNTYTEPQAGSEEGKGKVGGVCVCMCLYFLAAKKGGKKYAR